MSTPKANLEILPRGVQIALGLGLIALLAFPWVGTDFYTQMVTRMLIMAIFAMSLDLLQGVTGLVSLGHAAYFGKTCLKEGMVVAVSQNPFPFNR